LPLNRTQPEILIHFPAGGAAGVWDRQTRQLVHDRDATKQGVPIIFNVSSPARVKPT